MFVSPDGRNIIQEKRRRAFFKARLPALIAEARALGVDQEQLLCAVKTYMEENREE